METMRIRIDWSTDVGELAAVEPSPDDVAAHADALARGYNDPSNARLLGHDEPISAEEVVEHYAGASAGGRRDFLLLLDGRLVGDADVRGLAHGGGAAEFAFMIAAPSHQGKGLGTRFATMVHAFAFAELGLHHVYASIVPENTASRRVFEKLGYAVDATEAARAFADEPGDIVMSIARGTFEGAHRDALGAIRITSVTGSTAG